MRRIKRFIEKIRRLISWIPVIWRTYDWDYGYTIDIFKYSLLRQAKFFESDKSHIKNANSYAKRIRSVCDLMDKVYDDKYGMEYMNDPGYIKFNGYYSRFMECQNKQQRAHKLLWELIEHNIQNWWD